MAKELWLFLFLCGGIFFVAAALCFAWLLRPSKPSPAKVEAYECGEPVIGKAQVQYNIRYYLAALLFVIFDVEVIFLLPWAVTFTELGKAGFAAVMIFILILFLGWAYAWRKGALEWQ
jgi:NADH-quinone oxidoreductase subunit A